MLFRHLIRGLAFSVLATAMPAQAEWLRAESRHFVVYADIGEESLRRQAVELEHFDAVLRYFYPSKRDDAEAFNRVTVFVVPNVARIGKLAGSSMAAGFYRGSVSGPTAFTPRASSSLAPRTVLFHEYAHHYLLGNSLAAYPMWFSEGFAEFVGTVKPRLGTYLLGAAAMDRTHGLLNNKLPLQQLLDPPARLSHEQADALYGRSWLLTHYLMFDPARRQQLDKYLRLFNAGKPSAEAAREAFGDLRALDSALDRYLMQQAIPTLSLKASAFGMPGVSIRALTPGESALIDLRMESVSGVDEKTAPPLFAKAAAIASRYPRDPVAQGWFAEMGYDAGQFDAAEAAADAALAVDPRSSQALLYKARVRLRRAADARATAPAIWAEARSWILKANSIDSNDAAALALFHESFQQQGVSPTKGAMNALYRAAYLVPQDRTVRFRAARQLILDGDVPAAKIVLRPLASDPHAGADNAAVRLLALLDSGHSGQAAIDALGKAAPASEAATGN